MNVGDRVRVVDAELAHLIGLEGVVAGVEVTPEVLVWVAAHGVHYVFLSTELEVL